MKTNKELIESKFIIVDICKAFYYIDSKILFAQIDNNICEFEYLIKQRIVLKQSVMNILN
jgi:hypothetical protein